MAHSYIAYIDESGDEGLTGRYRARGQQGGSSHWLTISACIWRHSRDLESLAWRDEIRAQLAASSQRKPLHCKNLNHHQKVMAAQIVASKPIRAICVMANKPVIPAGIYTTKNQLYFYMCRYLFERISWFCRDSRPKVPEGDGKVQIIFSRRGGLQCADFRDYMTKLQRRVDDDIRINWPVIDIDAIESLDHDKRAGLQLADIVATCMSAGVEPGLYGNCEKRYAEILRPVIYQRNENYLSYGVKIVPRIDQIPLNAEQEAFVNLFR